MELTLASRTRISGDDLLATKKEATISTDTLPFHHQREIHVLLQVSHMTLGRTLLVMESAGTD